MTDALERALTGRPRNTLRLERVQVASTNPLTITLQSGVTVPALAFDGVPMSSGVGAVALLADGALPVIAPATSTPSPTGQQITDANLLAVLNPPIPLASSPTASRDFLDARYGLNLGEMRAPAPTGVAATDTPAFLAAVNAAQAQNLDLVLTPSPLGAVRNYVLSSAFTWNASKGTLRGRGHVGIDFSAVASSYSGPAITVTGNGGTNVDGSHMNAMHALTGFHMLGHNTDASTMDALLFTDTGMGVDTASGDHLRVYGFRDGVTLGDNVWSIDLFRVIVNRCHRYGYNLGSGTNAGECISLTDCTISDTKNATAGVAAGIYAPASGNVDFRMFGGSLDYNDTQGRIEGGSLTFDAVHIEDKNLGAMFTYSQSASTIHVSFTDCHWTSTPTAYRPWLHQILSGSGSKVTLKFDGDKGGIGAGFSTWVYDSSGNDAGDRNVQAAIARTGLNGAYLLGQLTSLLTNGTFDESSSFVASPGVYGWAVNAGSGGTFSIGTGGQPGNALKLVATTAGNYSAQQRIPLVRDGRPYYVGGKMFGQTITQGNLSINVRWLADDGTTAIGGDYRIGNVLNAANGQTTYWVYARKVRPPRNAAYALVLLTAASFVGTVFWDEVEAAPV